ncbi:hypothetical protein AUJ68_01190 [Candidatus Woesearchaeota archaeon CG1_02_57_44]|nr:MAG: hypothetical protein AUJ68_01190 [Candidatus Woesearchaeota archaeon CG1_02_57_44]
MNTKRKKVTKQRGSHTHGGGAKKKRRGAGHRGGVGMAGTGKRADVKKPSIWGSRYFGKHGFKSKPDTVLPPSINVQQLDEQADSFVSAGLGKKEGDAYHIDLVAAGYGKVLGNGKINRKLHIKARSFSIKAQEAITAAGGSAEQWRSQTS